MVSLNITSDKVVSNLVHRLLGIHYIPNPNNYPLVCHKDDDKMNCQISNLYWGTYSDNMKDRINNGNLNCIPGAISRRRKIISIDDNNNIKTFESIRAAGFYYDINPQNISYALSKNGKTHGYHFQYAD